MRFAGHLTVRDIELAERDRVIGLRVDPEDAPFLDLPFAEAIQHMQSRRLVPPDQFAAMSDEERFRSFTMTQVASEEIRDRALDRLRDAMEPGGIGLDGFVASIQADEASLGFTPSSRGYLDNVYRTATAVSYGGGRLEQQLQPEVLAVLPFWQYLTAGDERVRPRHQALHETIYRAGDPAALPVYPPNGFRCRCTMVAVDEDDLPKGFTLSQVDMSSIDEGFRAPPTVALQQDAGTARPAVQPPEAVPIPPPPPVNRLEEYQPSPEVTQLLESRLRNLTQISSSPARGAPVRDAVRGVLTEAGYGTRASEVVLDVEFTPVGLGGLHYPRSGRIVISPESARKASQPKPWRGGGSHIVIHEELHGASPNSGPNAGMSSRGAGAVVEEVAVEVSARRVSRGLRRTLDTTSWDVGDMHPTDPRRSPDVGEVDPFALPSGGTRLALRVYEREIDAVMGSLRRRGGLTQREAGDAVELASQRFLQGDQAAPTLSPEDHVDRWLSGLPDTVTPEARDAVRADILAMTLETPLNK